MVSTTDERIDVTLDPAKEFRSVRLRVVKPGSAEKPDLWTAIRAFEIKPQDAATLRTDIPAFAAQPVRSAANMISISPSLEVHPFPPGKFIGLLLPEVANIKRFQLDLKSATPEKDFALEATADGRDWKPLTATINGTTLTATDSGKALAVRVRNTGRATASVTLAKFEVTAAGPNTPTGSLAALSDGDLAPVARVVSGTSIPRPAS